MTGTPLNESNVMPNDSTAPGFVAVGRLIQSVAVQIHVSAIDVRPLKSAVPPCSTIMPRHRSVVIACDHRAGGVCAVASCCQTMPFHAQVSLKAVTGKAKRPPNRIIRLLRRSYAIAEKRRADGPFVATCVQVV